MFKKLYPTAYTADVSTRVSNSLLVGKMCPNRDNSCFDLLCYLGAILGQVFVGLLCDRIGRKV